MISIILIESEYERNIGYITRVMQNFGFYDLVLIDPKCNHLGNEAIQVAKHSLDILKKARVEGHEFLKTFDHLVATTAKMGGRNNVSRSPLTPTEMSEKLAVLPKSQKIGILIGRDGPGLKNEEVDLCDMTVTIPTSKDYSALNISHALAILLYELSKNTLDSKDTISSHIVAAEAIDKATIDKVFLELIKEMGFDKKEKEENQKKLWKKVLGKSMLTKQEARGVIGFLRRVQKRIKNS